MNDSMKDKLSTLYESAMKESEDAAAKVRNTFRLLVQQLETPREDIAQLKARVEALEAKVAELQASQPRD